MDVVIVNNFFLIGVVLVGMSIFVSLLFFCLGILILVIFFVVGMIVGNDGVGGIVFDNYLMVYLVGNLVFVVIFFDGGLCICVFSFCVVFWLVLLLVILGVLVIIGLIGIVVVWLFDLYWMEGLLIGVIVGFIDVVVVFFLFGGKGFNEWVIVILEIELGSNDLMVVFFIVILIEMFVSG